MAEPLLTVEELSLSYRVEAGLVRVLDGVNLAIAAGEIVGLVGESGCGKSTLGRAILGALPRGGIELHGGAIRFGGRDLMAMAEQEAAQTIRGRAITLIPQDPFTSFNPLFTIGGQIADLARFKCPELTKPQRLARTLELLDAVQLPQPRQILAKYPHEVSGGQRQRLMIAMALLPNPKLIVADEPTTALDVTIQAQILGLLRRLANERGCAVLFTTHDLGAAYEICDSIAVMYAGQNAEAAPVKDFFERPRHPYTTALLASLLDGSGRLQGIPGEVPSLITPPQGCRFNPRCGRALDTCRAHRPAFAGPVGGHRLACHNPSEAGHG
ncbi:MAG: ABC transporter ATP-binding protein [Alphaproteobacteria bacterium]|nr:ABC transporter ATP-binding protein [Alphaproteobacteria bacterium]